MGCGRFGIKSLVSDFSVSTLNSHFNSVSDSGLDQLPPTFQASFQESLRPSLFQPPLLKLF